MTALTDALANLKQIYANQGALADPAPMLADAEMAWRQAVTDAINTGTGAVLTQLSSTGEVSTTAVDVAALQAQNTELSAKVAAGEQAISAFEAIIHPAEPSSTEPVAAAEIAPTIAPTTGA